MRASACGQHQEGYLTKECTFQAWRLLGDVCIHPLHLTLFSTLLLERQCYCGKIGLWALQPVCSELIM